jgi:hypothetical protein
VRSRAALAGGILGLILIPATSEATVTRKWEGQSNKGVNVLVRADLTFSGNNLKIVLTNDSQNHSEGGADSANPDDLLTSFYFDIFDGSSRPTLTYTGASGNLWTLINGGSDTDETDIDLRAFNDGDDSYQFKDTFSTGINGGDCTTNPGQGCWTDKDGVPEPLLIGNGELHFGLGTAGNKQNLPNHDGFNGMVVDGLDYGIFSGADIETASLSNLLAVKDRITFNFTGVSGFTEADIADEALFGFGTRPDSMGYVPEPGTGLLLGMALVGVGWIARRRRL